MGTAPAVVIGAPPEATANHQAINTSVPASAHLAAAQPAVFKAAAPAPAPRPAVQASVQAPNTNASAAKKPKPGEGEQKPEER